MTLILFWVVGSVLLFVGAGLWQHLLLVKKHRRRRGRLPGDPR